MKKYLLPLIIILCLAFTLPVYSADLFDTYDQRIKLTVDHTKIDADVTWFPVTVFFTNNRAFDLYSSNPVITRPSGADSYRSSRYPSAVYVDDEYKVYYYEHDSEADHRKISLATSADGYTFTKSPSNPVLQETTETWDAIKGVVNPCIFYEDNTYYLFYTGGDVNKTGLATSVNGTSFTKITDGIGDTSMVLDHGEAGQWDEDAANIMSVVWNASDEKYWAYYVGGKDGVYSIGLAKSTDLKNWTRYGENPIMTAAGWEGNHVGKGKVFYSDGKWRMYYRGNIGADNQMGYAESSNGISWTKSLNNPLWGKGCGWESYFRLDPEFIFLEGDSSNEGLLYYTGCDVKQGNEIGVMAQSTIGVFDEKVLFREFDADEDFDRCAFTTDDGETQLYADCELFSKSTNQAIYLVSKTGWSISNTADTDFYYYFDNDADHNTTYISMGGGTAAQSVYDNDTKLRSDMKDATTSTILDSTSNNNDGTKGAANQPAELAGNIGQGQNFELGTTDYIEMADSASLSITGDFTISFCYHSENASPDVAETWIAKYTEQNDDRSYRLRYREGTPNYLELTISDDGTSGAGHVDTLTCNADLGTDWKYITVTWDASESTAEFFVDGVSLGMDVGTITSLDDNDSVFDLGIYRGNTGQALRPLDGLMDEARIDGTIRSDDWIAASYDSLWDTLLTYGSEERPGITWNGIVITKWNGVIITIPLNTQ